MNKKITILIILILISVIAVSGCIESGTGISKGSSSGGASDNFKTMSFGNWEFEIPGEYNGGESASKQNAIISLGNNNNNNFSMMVYAEEGSQSERQNFGNNGNIETKSIGEVNYEIESYKGPAFNVQIINYKFSKDGTEFFIHTKVPLSDFSNSEYMENYNQTIELIIATIKQV